MEMDRCFKALGFHERPESREAVEAAYEQQKKQALISTDTRPQAGVQSATAHGAALGATESDKLAAHLLEENYRACLRLMNANE